MLYATLTSAHGGIRVKYRMNFFRSKKKSRPIRWQIAWCLFALAFWLLGYDGWYVTSHQDWESLPGPF